MSKHESQQVLSKPAGEILEYDPQALREAYHLTHGQPYLLQMLGSVIIEHFDSAVLAEQPRSNYVSLRDMQQAAKDLVQRGNSAFENYWQDASADIQQIYSVLAWACEGKQRDYLDIVELEQFLGEQKFKLSRELLFQYLESLCEQGLLNNTGSTYGFCVPLFQRWLAWRWPPQKVRMGLAQ